MRIYTFPILTIIGCIGLIIYLLIDFKRNQFKNLFHRVLFYSFILYLIVVSDLTIGAIFIPPQTSNITLQFIPFNFIGDLYSENVRGTWFLLNSIKLYFYNLILLFPLGVYLGILYQVKRVQKAVIIVLYTSLAIEILQPILSSFGFIFNRSFDVDDLILNTLGGGLGFLAWLRISKIKSFKKIRDRILVKN
ncbi:VanZ family protein [Peribacillus muralis]|uniref:VanZ family protein n=1 Tax=Peribacillus muralis TaxID=264697 RepID=UPI00070DA7D7|nr:VanZ family protein [Peribacillus muralis]